MAKARLPLGGAVRVTSVYGERVDPLTGQAGCFHGGLDLVSDAFEVCAAAEGLVVVSQMVTDPRDPSSEWGNYVCVLGNDGRYCYYCHLASREVERGELVRAGQVLGRMGSTGKSTGVHLHFEVRNANNVKQNAAAYLGIENVAGPIAAPCGDSMPAEWAREAIRWAQSAGILQGDGQGDLHLREVCTREMALVFLHRAVGALTGGGEMDERDLA